MQLKRPLYFSVQTMDGEEPSSLYILLKLHLSLHLSEDALEFEKEGVCVLFSIVLLSQECAMGGGRWDKGSSGEDSVY